jgi:hypothetical protein
MIFLCLRRVRIFSSQSKGVQHHRRNHHTPTDPLCIETVNDVEYPHKPGVEDFREWLNDATLSRQLKRC